MVNPETQSKAEYWEKHYTQRHREIDSVGLAKSLDYSNERVQFQTYSHMLEGAGVLTNKNVLDAGCGWGNFSIILYGIGAIVTGIDIISGTVEELRKHRPFITWQSVDISNEEQCATLGMYDCITATEVLQYVDFAATINLLWPHVTPSGRLVGCVPNRDCPLAQSAMQRFAHLWEPVSQDSIASLAQTLPDVQEIMMKGLYFREDQHFLPYQASDWVTQLEGTPNRIVFVILRGSE